MFLVYPVKPSPTLNPPCQALCIKEYHSFYDPTAKKCTCVPDKKKEQECLSETICVEFDVPMAPVWDNESKTCSCEPRNDDKFICIAASTCLPGSSPYWNPITKNCNCRKAKTVINPNKRGAAPLNSSSPTMIATQTSTPTVDTCTLLKIFCECGDHRQHWSEEKQSCQCPPCAPVMSLGCENLLIYCNDGDHRMHWNPVSKKCECPLPTTTTLKPAKRAIFENTDPKPVASTITPAPAPTSRIDTCPLLKMLCPCGDRHLHVRITLLAKSPYSKCCWLPALRDSHIPILTSSQWNEELQQCACQPCNPPSRVVCENFEIYCSGGDHRMHWDPVSGKCQCLVPMVTDYAPEPLPTM